MPFYYPTPAYGLISSSYPRQARYFCLLCRAPLVPLPTLEDFKTFPHSASSRIKLITNERGWRFENFRGQVYFRSLGKVPAWSFWYPGGFTRLCVHQEAEIEMVYGQFVYPDLAADKDWIFKGYKHTGPQNALSIWFSEKDYAGCAFNQERTRTGEVASFSPKLEVPRQQIPPRSPVQVHSTPSRQQIRPSSPVQVHSAPQVFSELQKAFVEKYKEKGNWRSRCPLKIDFAQYEVNQIFDLTDHKETCFDENETSHTSIFQSFDVKNKRILVQAAPGFGKTTLTSILGHQWAHNASEIKHYELCILCDLLRMPFKTDVTREIVNSCVKMLNSTFNTHVVRESLTRNSENIVLILDNYDLLPEDLQHELLLFFETSSVFLESTIIITTRPTDDVNLLKLFQKHIYIRGFSKNYFTKYLSLHQREHVSVSYLCEKIGDFNMYHLSSLSPYFTWFIYKVTCENFSNDRNHPSLCALLDYTIQTIVSEHLISSSPNLEPPDQLFQKLGEMSFHALVENYLIFQVEDLQRAFGDKFGILVQCNIFHRKDRQGKSWFVFSKVLKVFFATMYLRNEWSKLRNDEQRRRFLREVFCCGACLGDHIQGEDCLYYVGLIPEVVLKLTSDCSLGSASFEMYHDVERVEHSTAFDSVNLVSRISENYLKRFHFRIIPRNNPLHTKTFRCIFDFTSVNNCNVVYSFYTNDYEDKRFMMIKIRRDEENSVLKAILRAKTETIIDRIYIDFVYRDLEDLFGFLSALLSQYLKGFELPDDLKNVQPINFVFNLVWLIFSSIQQRSATIVCGCNENDSFKLFASFKLCWNSVSRKKEIFVFDGSFKPTKYNADSFPNAESEIQTLLGHCEKHIDDLRISINLF